MPPVAVKKNGKSVDKIKRRLRRWRLAAIILIAFVFVPAIYSTLMDWLDETSPHIARIEVNGVIEGDLARDQKLAAVADDPHITAVIVHLDTPGGTVVGGETLYGSIKAIRAKKPVVAVMGDIATSAGYMVALGADYIIAHNGTLTGSIGVLLQSVELSELSRKVGIKMDMVKSSPLKGSPSPFERMTPQVRASMQSVIDSFYQIFIEMVMKERKLTKEYVMHLADGRVYTGNQALAAKLVDAIGGEQEALDWLKKSKKIDITAPVRDLETKQKPSKLREFLDELGLKTSLAPLERFSLQGLISIW